MADDRDWIGEDGKRQVEPRHRFTAKQITGGILVLVVVVLVLQNAHDAHVTLLIEDFSAPMWLVLGSISFVAFMAGWLFGGHRRAKRE